MKESSVEMLQAASVEVDARLETKVVLEPTAEVLGSIMELSAGKRWFNEGPGRPDMG